MFEDSVVIDETVRRELEKLLTLDLLHMRPALCALDAARDAFPQAVHVAAFDTAFHRTLSKAAAGYALPTEWTQKWGLRRFGFHGTSHRFVSARLAALLERFRTLEPELVINCAAATNVDRCETEPDRAYRVNAWGAHRVLV